MTYHQDDWTFYRNPQVPLVGTASGAVYSLIGSAASASAITIYANYKQELEYARWVLVWNPNTGDSPTGVRLAWVDGLPGVENEIVSIQKTNYTSPKVDAVDITLALRNLMAMGYNEQAGKFLIQQTFGNGANGCLIYSSIIETVWRVDPS